MIIGIGTDLCDSRRIEKILSEKGDKFIARVFTNHEQETAESRNDKALYYAKRWAAKEACAKALGLGFRDGLLMSDFEVRNNDKGKPEMHISGRSLDLIKDQHGEVKIHLSLTDEAPYASAYVVIEK